MVFANANILYQNHTPTSQLDGKNNATATQGNCIYRRNVVANLETNENKAYSFNCSSRDIFM